MISLESITHGKVTEPPRVGIHADTKVGKTTFAAGAPKPIFIQTERGADQHDVAKFPLAESFADVTEALTVLARDEHDFKTVVIDSLDWLEKLAQQHVCKEKGWQSIEQPGYGKGYVEASNAIKRVFDMLEHLNTVRKMAIIVIAHSEIKSYESPELESYDRHQIKCHKHVGSLLREWADVIGYAHVEQFFKSTDEGFGRTAKKAIGSGRRLLELGKHPAYEAGNRYGMPDQIELSWPAFEAAFREATA